MSLNISKGNMYPWITHTWNTVKGECPHECAYCYMHRFGKQNPVRFDSKELKTDLGEGNFIFVGSSCDMFANSIENEWIEKTLEKCRESSLNRYLFQSKNPYGIALHDHQLPSDSVICTTIETNRFYADCKAVGPSARARGMEMLPGFLHFVTIEPIMDFDLEPLVEILKRCDPVQVNIGADTGNNHLPEPPAEKVLALIEALQSFTTIARKSNLERITGIKP